MNLYERLMWTAKRKPVSDAYARAQAGRSFTMANPYAFDVTEIDGTDNLHQPEGENLWEMEQMKQKYGTKDSYLFGKWKHVWHLSSDFCLLSSGRYDCDCQKLPPFGVPCRGTFVVEAGLCISGSR